VIQPRKPSPKWLTTHRHDRYRRSRNQEQRIARSFPKGKRLPRSGGLAWSRHDGTTAGGDVVTSEFLLECKLTRSSSITIKRSWLDKVRDGARRLGKDPGLVITFERHLEPPEDWIFVPLAVAKRRL
jgi:hypothetical protein